MNTWWPTSRRPGAPRPVDRPAPPRGQRLARAGADLPVPLPLRIGRRPIRFRFRGRSGGRRDLGPPLPWSAVARGAAAPSADHPAIGSPVERPDGVPFPAGPGHEERTGSATDGGNEDQDAGLVAKGAETARAASKARFTAAQYAQFGNRYFLAVLPALNPAALERKRDPSRDVSPWLDLSVVLWNADLGKEYPREGLQEVRRSFRDAAAAYRDRERRTARKGSPLPWTVSP